MKTMISVISVFLCCLFISVNAQETEVKKIREMYNSYNTLISKQGDDSQADLPQKVVIQSTVTERAIGPVSKTVTMYYDRNENITDNTFTYTNVLRKIVILEESNCTSYSEFLFDSKENLVFCYYKHDGFISECKEKRFYYKDGELIKIIFTKNPDSMASLPCAEGTREMSKLTPSDKKEAGIIKKFALRHINMFHLYVDPM